MSFTECLTRCGNAVLQRVRLAALGKTQPPAAVSPAAVSSFRRNKRETSDAPCMLHT